MTMIKISRVQVLNRIRKLVLPENGLPETWVISHIEHMNARKTLRKILTTNKIFFKVLLFIVTRYR